MPKRTRRRLRKLKLLELFPATHLQQLCANERVEFVENAKEYLYSADLRSETKSLQEFESFLFNNEEGIQENRIVWIGKKKSVFVSNHDVIECLPGDWECSQFSITFQKAGERARSVRFHSESSEAALECLVSFFGLKDSYYDELCIHGWCDVTMNEAGYRYPTSPMVCPFTIPCMEKILRTNAKRKNTFLRWTLTPEQSRAIVLYGTRTDLLSCKFSDNGVAFTATFAEILDTGSGLSELRMCGSPFHPRDQEASLTLFFDQVKLERLELDKFRLNRQATCKALAFVNVVKALVMTSCQLGDAGYWLVQSVLAGQGPRGLELHMSVLETLSQQSLFLQALAGNTHIVRLILHDLQVTGLSAITHALQQNRCLVQFGLHSCRVTGFWWGEIIDAISVHPTLSSLQFSHIEDDNCPNGHASDGPGIARWERTDKLAMMLAGGNHRITEIANEEIEERYFRSFDSEDWDRVVIPLVECNRYRKRIETLPKIEQDLIRAGIIARELAQVSEKPWLIWMLLSQNRDTLCWYLLRDTLTERQLRCERRTMKRQRREIQVLV